MELWIAIGITVAVQLVLVGFAVHFILRLLLVMIGWKQQLPFVPTVPRTINAIITDGALEGKQHIIDLGSGTGSMIAGLRKAYPKATFRGIEHHWWLVFLSRLRFLGRRNTPRFTQGDLFAFDISKADAIVGFWIPELLTELINKLESETGKDITIVSNMFPLPENSTFEERRVDFPKKATKKTGKFFVYTKRQP